MGDGPLYKLELVDAVRDTAALLEGDDEDMSWEIYHQRAMIPPRQLAQTLLRQPMCQHLVPESLEAFITGTKAATAKPNLVPEKDLEDFIKREEARLGKIPAKNNLVAPAKEQFPRYRGRKEDVFSAHEKMYGAQPPGPRKKKYAG